MYSHIMLGTNDLSESIRFYDQVMSVLGYSRESTGETFAGYGSKDDISTGMNCFWIGVPIDGEPASPGNGVNVALLATTRNQVNTFYEVALKSGGFDEGAPGIREEAHSNFYATYIRDPAGNKIVVVCHAEQTA